MDRIASETLDPATPFLADPKAQALCQTLEAAGHVALFVGGCVRNAVLRAPASDIDISTDAVPDAVMRIADAAGYRAVPTGVDHGTVTVVVDGAAFEVTTFRRDVATDGRRAVVAFSTDVTEDALRRDFTMNALYADRYGVILDPLGGLPDARAGRVRFIEDAGQRIREDYLRILRFFRFHVYYGDDAWDADALAGIATNLDGLETLSAERVGAEMLRLLAAPDPAPAVGVMERIGVLHRILPGAVTTFLAPLVHLEALVGTARNPITRLAALGGKDVVTLLRLSRKDQKLRDSIQELSVSTWGAKSLGHVGGAEAGIGAILLRAAMANTPLDPHVIEDVATGAKASFPLAAKDFPDLSGPDLGARLKELKATWLASDLAKTKNDLLAS